MFVFKSNQRRANPYSQYVGTDGTVYPKIPSDLLDEITEPTPPEGYSEDFFYKVEMDEAPYVIYTRKSDEQIAAITLQKAKQKRQTDVESIVVTSALGNAFDGNEEAQTRMARAIVALGELNTTQWVLANNTVVEVTREELLEVLQLAGAQQTAIWITPYDTMENN